MVMNSPYDEVTPVIYSVLNYAGNMAIIKIKSNETAKDALGKIEPIFKSFNPMSHSTTLVDDDYEKKIPEEERVSKLASFFAILAVAVSCLGLFGLTSYVAEQRKKEIGAVEFWERRCSTYGICFRKIL